MDETKKKEQASTHKIGIYLWIWGLLFVLSFFSYLVDWYQFQGMLRWSLILIFMFLKAGLIMAFFMHLFWERYALVNVLLLPMTAIAMPTATATATAIVIAIDCNCDANCFQASSWASSGSDSSTVSESFSLIFGKADLDCNQQ